MNAHVKPIVDVSQQQREFVLAGLRCVVKRLEHIREEVTPHWRRSIDWLD